jgi:thiol:disulfide interchange protein
MLALGLVVVALGLGMVQLRRGWHELGEWSKRLRAIGLVLAALGGFWLLFGATEAPPLSGQVERLAWEVSYERALERVKQEGKPLLVDFTAEWCNACHELDAEVFQRPAVREELMSRFVLLRVDFDEETPQNKMLLNRFEVSGLPSVVFVSEAGVHLRGVSFEGKVNEQEFMERVGKALRGEGAQRGAGLEEELNERGLAWVMVFIFLAGLLSSLTPCVYPLIPITVALFGAKEAKTRLEGFTLSVAYVVGIMTTYTAMGVGAALFGGVFGGLMQSAWVLAGVSLLFVTLGLSSAGAFDVRLPGWLQEGLSQKGGAGYAGAWVMGSVAGIIAAPCVGPVVGAILLYVTQRQEVWLGGSMLAVFALGLGVPFMILGTFSSLLGKLPRSGGWMEGIKLLFAVCFWAIALYYARLFLSPIGELSRCIWRGLASWLG